MQNLENNTLKKLKQIVPKLLSSRHKGQNGRIGVVGGCFEYTGAPFYSAISILKGGGDLAHIFCTSNASIPIKSYSPEVIVHPYLCSREDVQKETQELNIKQTIDKMLAWYNALHSFVVGPGLGRDEIMAKYLNDLIKNMMKSHILVLDADGLWYLSQGPSHQELGLSIRERAALTILTPNINEFEMLCKTYIPSNTCLTRQRRSDIVEKIDFQGQEFIEIDAGHEFAKDVVALSIAMNYINILLKGRIDLITNGKKVYLVNTQGSLKRCGGIGDVLSGLTSLYTFWGKSLIDNEIIEEDQKIIYGCLLSSYITRKASFKAYDKYKFALTAPNVIEKIGESFNEFYFDAKL